MKFEGETPETGQGARMGPSFSAMSQMLPGFTCLPDPSRTHLAGCRARYTASWRDFAAWGIRGLVSSVGPTHGTYGLDRARMSHSRARASPEEDFVAPCRTT